MNFVVRPEEVWVRSSARAFFSFILCSTVYSGFQTVCRGTLGCRQKFKGCRNFFFDKTKYYSFSIKICLGVPRKIFGLFQGAASQKVWKPQYKTKSSICQIVNGYLIIYNITWRSKLSSKRMHQMGMELWIYLVSILL